ncbi:MAG: IS3 family transposase [Chloroflexota bacterium]|nr:IS3 family transposase [Chloroflexota bacterium]
MPTKRSARRTTRGAAWHDPNLLHAVQRERVHQVWVADITYLTTEEGFRYLALLTDAWSRFIVGYDLSAALAFEGCARALEQAVARTPPTALRGLIHHSDHGVQYSAYPYCDRLRTRGIHSSMRAVGNCYENPLAERVNGILKGEYGLDALFVDQSHAQRAVAAAIDLYNYERPHLALAYAKPAEVHCRA